MGWDGPMRWDRDRMEKMGGGGRVSMGCIDGSSWISCRVNWLCMYGMGWDGMDASNRN